jgi:hypothetical protein
MPVAVLGSVNPEAEKMMGITKLWSVEQLSEFLGVPRTWIYDRTREQGPEIIPLKCWLSAHVVGLDTQTEP